MKSKYNIYFSLFAAFFLFCSQSFAETIYMRDGKVINAKIVERGSNYIIAIIDGMPRRYLNEQIERIKENESKATSKAANNEKYILYFDFILYSFIVVDIG